MADINPTCLDDADRAGAPGPEGSLGPKRRDDREHLTEFVEQLFFAYRDFTAEADAELAALKFGRAHHRVLHFVYRRPGLRVADLLEILKITKQSLARVLKQLVDRGYVSPQAGEADRRERRLFVTAKGAALADRLLDLQTRRVARALNAGGADSDQIVRLFLNGLMGEDRPNRGADAFNVSRRRVK